MKEYYQKSWTRVVELLGSNVYKGLMEYDCIVRREQYGDNKVIIPNRKSIGRSLLEKLFSLSSFIYLFVIILFIVSKQYIFLLIELIAFSLSILGIINVSAESANFYEAEYIDNIYMVKYQPSTKTKYYQKARFFRRTITMVRTPANRM